MSISRKDFVAATLASGWAFTKKVTPINGLFVIGSTKKGEAVMVPRKLRQMVTSSVLREMLTEARALGLTGDFYVFGSATTVGGSSAYHFKQIHPATGEVLT